jgi:hypothetical protein
MFCPSSSQREALDDDTKEGGGRCVENTGISKFSKWQRGGGLYGKVNSSSSPIPFSSSYRA